jgi:hypothetical protein
LPAGAQSLIGHAQRTLGSDRIAFEELGEPGEDVHLEQLRGDTQLLDQPHRDDA